MNILVSIHSPFEMWVIPDTHVAMLRRDFPSHDFLHARGDDEARTLIDQADVAFSSQITREQFAVARRLRWIHSPAAGVGGMLFPEMVASPVVITNSRGMSADTIAEHVLGLTIALFRRLPLAVRRQLGHEWAQDEISRGRANRTIAGSRVLIVGLGAIGSAVARRMAALGAHVSGIRRQTNARSDGVQDVASPDRLNDLLPAAEVVVIAAPQTCETRGLFGDAQFEAMSRDALLINVSRGKLVDEAALARALDSGAIAGAALDVFAHEPLDPGSPLWDMPNVLITPHTSGFRPDHWDAATALFADNLRRFEQGQALVNVVDKLLGY